MLGECRRRANGLLAPRAARVAGGCGKPRIPTTWRSASAGAPFHRYSGCCRGAPFARITDRFPRAAGSAATASWPTTARRFGSALPAAARRWADRVISESGAEADEYRDGPARRPARSRRLRRAARPRGAAPRPHGRVAAVAMLDLDGLRAVNQHHGAAPDRCASDVRRHAPRDPARGRRRRPDRTRRVRRPAARHRRPQRRHLGDRFEDELAAVSFEHVAGPLTCSVGIADTSGDQGLMEAAAKAHRRMEVIQTMRKLRRTRGRRGRPARPEHTPTPRSRDQVARRTFPPASQTFPSVPEDPPPPWARHQGGLTQYARIFATGRRRPWLLRS